MMTTYSIWTFWEQSKININPICIHITDNSYLSMSCATQSPSCVMMSDERLNQFRSHISCRLGMYRDSFPNRPFRRFISRKFNCDTIASHVFVADLRLIFITFKKSHKIILTFWLVCILSEPKILVTFLFEWDWLSHFYFHTKVWTKNRTFSYQFDDCSKRLYGYKSQLSTVIIIVFQQVKSVFSLI